MRKKYPNPLTPEDIATIYASLTQNDLVVVCTGYSLPYELRSYHEGKFISSVVEGVKQGGTFVYLRPALEEQTALLGGLSEFVTVSESEPAAQVHQKFEQQLIEKGLTTDQIREHVHLVHPPPGCPFFAFGTICTYVVVPKYAGGDKWGTLFLDVPFSPDKSGRMILPAEWETERAFAEYTCRMFNRIKRDDLYKLIH